MYVVSSSKCQEKCPNVYFAETLLTPKIKSKYFRTGECVGIGQATVLDRFGTLLLYKVAVDRESGRKLYQYWLMIVLLMAVDRADTAVYGLARRSFLY